MTVLQTNRFGCSGAALSTKTALGPQARCIRLRPASKTLCTTGIKNLKRDPKSGICLATFVVKACRIAISQGFLSALKPALRRELSIVKPL